MSEDQPKPRTAIPKHLHVIVDSVLKDLRTVSKRITVFTVPFQEELRVLERLFYKNKNQHKSAVFWRKVPELRKYGKRVIDLNILTGVQSFRYRFYGDNEKTDPKVLRGPWTQLPAPSSLKSVLDWLKSVSCLLHQARTRFCNAYSTFRSHARCGSFLSLLVVLLAVLSRLDFLIGELQQTLSLYWKALYWMFKEVMLSSTSTSLNPFLPSESLGNVSITNLINKPSRPSEIREDIGKRIDRVTLPTCQRDTAESIVANAISEKPIPYSKSGASGLQVKNLGVSSHGSTVKTLKKRNKHRDKTMKRDDIDDIFDL